jgi:hypothetical protein
MMLQASFDPTRPDLCRAVVWQCCGLALPINPSCSRTLCNHDARTVPSTAAPVAVGNARSFGSGRGSWHGRTWLRERGDALALTSVRKPWKRMGRSLNVTLLVLTLRSNSCVRLKRQTRSLIVVPQALLALRSNIQCCRNVSNDVVVGISHFLKLSSGRATGDKPGGWANFVPDWNLRRGELVKRTVRQGRLPLRCEELSRRIRQRRHGCRSAARYRGARDRKEQVQLCTCRGDSRIIYAQARLTTCW